jgi:hypothetical protein
MTTTNNFQLKNADGLFELLSESPQDTRELIADMIYQYNRLNLEYLRNQGESKHLVDSVNEHTHFLKQLSDSLISIEINRIE